MGKSSEKNTTYFVIRIYNIFEHLYENIILLQDSHYSLDKVQSSI